MKIVDFCHFLSFKADLVPSPGGQIFVSTFYHQSYWYCRLNPFTSCCSIMSLPKTMRAAVVEAHGKPLVIKDVALPVPGENDVLVKLEMSGVCHTDIHVQDGDWSMKSALPIIPGHEGILGHVSLAWRPSPGLLSWCLIIQSSHYELFEDFERYNMR